MSTKKIYIVRHGQTDFNKQGIVQGSGVDSDINATGMAQAEEFFKAYKDVKFDKIYTSTLKRSQQSVKNFVDLGIPSEALKGLDEICWGNKEGQKIDPAEDAYYHHVLDKWRAGETDFPVDGGESAMDVYKRQEIAMEYIFNQEGEEQILICMHGRAIRIILCLLLGTHLKDMDQYKHSNLCLYLLEYKEGNCTLIRANDLSHMS